MRPAKGAKGDKLLKDKEKRTEKPEFATFEEAFYLMKVVEAILESNKSGSWVHIS